MKNKKSLTFLTVVLAMGMILGACGKGGSNSQATSKDDSSNPVTSSSVPESSSPSFSCSCYDPSSSSVATNKHAVSFVVDGDTVQTIQVEDGELAVYEGETPTKKDDPNSRSYRFTGWDNDLEEPIVADTVFVAQFMAVDYADEILIDDFESYRSTGVMKEAGWKAMGYDSSAGWTTNTKAAVSLGYASVEGKQSLKFSAWENDVGYEIVRDVAEGEFTKSANALRFRLKVPSINTVKVLLKGKVNIGGTDQLPSFSYEFAPGTGEFVEYTLPLADDNWILWDDPEKTLHNVAGWTGVHEDDFLQYLTSIVFFIKGSDSSYGGQGWPYEAFLDSVRFVTIDNKEVSKIETFQQYDRYTGTLASGKTIKIELGANNAATATVLDTIPSTVQGTIAIDDNKNITFTSNDNGATLTYVGKLTNGGQMIKFVSASGVLEAEVENMRLDAVQVVDNYEQYETDGVLYHAGENPTTEEERSGCRGAYYAEYYKGSGSAPWGKNGWSLMEGQGDQLKLKQDAAGAHSGNNYVSLKHNKGAAMRYMQWGLFDGTSEMNSFRGNKLSFWAKSDGWVKYFKVYMFSQNAPTLGTMTERVKVIQFEESAAIDEWKHYELDLNPNIVYYGFIIMMEKNYDLSVNQAFLFLDDVEVYYASPYLA